MKSGIELIAVEREEQLSKHQCTVQGDVKFNDKGQLIYAARTLCQLSVSNAKNICPTGWDAYIWIRLLNKPYKERLIIAGALIAAELDRLNAIGE